MAAAPLGLQGIRMADHPPLPPGKGAEEGGQAAGVVVVAVGEGDGPHLGQVDAHGGGVLQIQAGVAGVQENFLLPVLQQAAEPRFPFVIVIDEGGILHQNGQLHRGFLPRYGR